MIYYLSNFSGVELLIAIVACLLAIVIAFTIHEFAHAFVSHKLGDTTPKMQGRLTLNPLAHIDPIGFVGILLLGIGWAKPVEINAISYKNYRKGMFLVSIAGVVVNIIAAFIFSGIYYALLRFIPSTATTEYVVFGIILFLQLFIVMNIALFIFNLLPFYPLDGYRIISVFTKHNNRIMLFLQKYSYGMIISILILNVVFNVNLISIAVDTIYNLFISFWHLIIA